MVAILPPTTHSHAVRNSWTQTDLAQLDIEDILDAWEATVADWTPLPPSPTPKPRDSAISTVSSSMTADSLSPELAAFPFAPVSPASLASTAPSTPPKNSDELIGLDDLFLPTRSSAFNTFTSPSKTASSSASPAPPTQRRPSAVRALAERFEANLPPAPPPPRRPSLAPSDASSSSSGAPSVGLGLGLAGGRAARQVYPRAPPLPASAAATANQSKAGGGSGAGFFGRRERESSLTSLSGPGSGASSVHSGSGGAPSVSKSVKELEKEERRARKEEKRREWEERKERVKRDEEAMRARAIKEGQGKGRMMAGRGAGGMLSILN
ncbi:hypothetical protein Rhopal_004024-T1 [Rhodotorula paludigena]|uniref:Uncharacterized protein n=1 Tax=Rhodotorula paludigena TaxID=86838 RepID=A0AAV5GEQ6_9BASI|nr:hypothetical protein Rhopal_004024-T1 [Rhodotorula paludigena]